MLTLPVGISLPYIKLKNQLKHCVRSATDTWLESNLFWNRKVQVTAGTVLVSKHLVREERSTILAFKTYLLLKNVLLFILLVVYFVSILCIEITGERVGLNQ